MESNRCSENSVRRLTALLASRGLSVCTAESCTGGLIGARLTETPGASAYFRGGVIAYDNAVKTRVLGVPADILGRRGAVSPETARAMALRAREMFQADCALAVSGIAGPSGGSAEKPVGLVCLGAATTSDAVSARRIFDGDRGSVREQSVSAACDLLHDLLLESR
jgi:PncC family amidohydrolase